MEPITHPRPSETQHPSLQKRLGLWLGILLTVTWVVAAVITAVVARHEIDRVFDSSLQETAQRLLPLAVAEVLGRDQGQLSLRLSDIRDHDELITYIVRDEKGNVLLQSHDADPKIFPAWSGVGFERTITHLFYNEEALQGTVRITVAESLKHRDSIAYEIQMALGLPILLMLPIAMVGIVLIVRNSLSPLRQFRDRLVNRDERDLELIPMDNLPAEVMPLATSLNDLLQRLAKAFESERSFTANAAHELRTPLAGAIAQAQRLRAEVADPAVIARTTELERTLKRMTRLSESLMQLSRAQAGQVRVAQRVDVCPLLQILTDDLQRLHPGASIHLQMPSVPVHSDINPDIFAIMYRNLLENAIRHGSTSGDIDVILSDDGLLTVANESEVVAPDALSRLTQRFERGQSASEGSGLGLAIVNAIAQRIGSELILRSPRSGSTSGFEASIRISGVARLS